MGDFGRFGDDLGFAWRCEEVGTVLPHTPRAPTPEGGVDTCPPLPAPKTRRRIKTALCFIIYR